MLNFSITLQQMQQKLSNTQLLEERKMKEEARKMKEEAQRRVEELQLTKD